MSGLLYASGGRGLLRYFFLHGSHERTSFPDQVEVEANVVSFARDGRVISGDNNEPVSQRYCFFNGTMTDTDGQAQALVPARELVETLLKNISVPALVLVEVPTSAISVLGRSDLRICVGEERRYLACMMRVFAPRFTQAMSQRRDEYLPGDAQNLSKEIARDMGASIADTAAATTSSSEREEEEEEDLLSFLQLYRQRYLGKSVTGNLDILEACLVHVLKMPFELASSVEQGLIRY
ncbi:hypothetical protein P170DRAFT_473877 [Aspergillus steynii IBT 23096]|uniref:Uncharacterized protein n=1 Tax=Aspergillus steynii IBT 23096 TaxID=1392250 RepID=A0A2I2GBQ6_9EURO|nr:uncharacterized protein P170DRAFT_473877 [Aspergillus steynii IBT 23096]PLB50314.1 hypothetical protein P170DRAFT_473877 [Aspergillus steynii IBT 23096]